VHHEPVAARLPAILARVSLALVCVMPVADLALSDAVSLWLLRAADGWFASAATVTRRLGVDAIVGAAIFSECFLLAWPVTRMRRLQGVFDGFEAYQEERRSRMGRVRAALSTAVNAPYAALGALADRVERFGTRLAERRTSPFVRTSARVLVDLGQVNAIGTTAVAMQEAAVSSTPVTWRRIAVLAALITVSWIAMAEVIRGVYALAALLGPPGRLVHAALDALGRLFDLLTGLDLTDPFSTPVSAVFLGAVALALAITGWNLARYHEARAATVG
jgi:hypothetical protein